MNIKRLLQKRLEQGAWDGRSPSRSALYRYAPGIGALSHHSKRKNMGHAGAVRNKTQQTTDWTIVFTDIELAEKLKYPSPFHITESLPVTTKPDDPKNLIDYAVSLWPRPEGMVCAKRRYPLTPTS